MEAVNWFFIASDKVFLKTFLNRNQGVTGTRRKYRHVDGEEYGYGVRSGQKLCRRLGWRQSQEKQNLQQLNIRKRSIYMCMQGCIEA